MMRGLLTNNVSFPEKDLPSLVRNLLESSNIHNIQEYEEKDMAEQLQNEDLD